MSDRFDKKDSWVLEMKYEWEVGGYEKGSATPRAPRLSDSALAMATRCK
jgi:hypothetical protein